MVTGRHDLKKVQNNHKELVGSGGDTFDFYLEGTRFAAWPGHQQVFHGFPHSLQEIVWIALQIRPHPLPATSFPVHRSTSILYGVGC
jgi:hypothetical protein